MDKSTRIQFMRKHNDQLYAPIGRKTLRIQFNSIFSFFLFSRVNDAATVANLGLQSSTEGKYGRKEGFLFAVGKLAEPLIIGFMDKKCCTFIANMT